MLVQVISSSFPDPLALFHSQILIGHNPNEPASTSGKTLLLRPRATDHCVQEHRTPPTEFQRVLSWSLPDSHPQLRRSDFTVNFIGRPVSARTTPRPLASCALLHAPSAPRSSWRKKEPIPSSAGSKAHLCALMLQLSLGEFFFFFLS